MRPRSSLADGRAELVGAGTRGLDGAEAVAGPRRPHRQARRPECDDRAPRDIFEIRDVGKGRRRRPAFRNCRAPTPVGRRGRPAAPGRRHGLARGNVRRGTDVDRRRGMGRTGLYRRHRGYRREYWFRSPLIRERDRAPVGVDLSKHLVALGAGSPLLRYDESRRTLSVPLGARLPELYERSAVLCSSVSRQTTRRLCLEFRRRPRSRDPSPRMSS